MFVAWRDLRFAKGRFALMGSVVVLITLLVGLLSGLTAGLARENISAVTGLDADHLAFAAPRGDQEVSFTNSTVREDDWRAWADRPGIEAAQPLGIRTLNATAAGERTAPVSAFGAEPDGTLAPEGIGPGRVVLSEKAAEELGAVPGDKIALGRVEREVAAVAGDASYSHTPVVWTTLDDWQQIGHDGAGPAEQATVIALTTTAGADLAAGDEAAETRTLSLDDSLTA
ncbi:ABC transporter permease, partial [Streptomyces sp. CBG30]